MSFWKNIAVYTLIFAGASWSGAVFSQVLFQGGYTRWCALFSMIPSIAAYLLTLEPVTNRKLQLAFVCLSMWLGLLLTCAYLATTDLVVLSDEGLWKRVLAVLSGAASLIALWQTRKLAQRVAKAP